MANRLMTMHYNTSLNARNVLYNYHKHRPLANIENTYNIHLEDDPFDYKKIVKRPGTGISTITVTSKSIKSDDDGDELIKRAIKSAPNFRATSSKRDRKHKRQKIDSNSKMNERQVKTATTTKRSQQIKQRSKSAVITTKPNDDSEIGQFLVLPMDEFGYSQRKKQLNQQIHDYWKQDSSQLSRTTRSSYQNSDQWITIVNENNTVENNKNQNLLIDTFTNVDNAKSDSVYHVSNEIGSLIAQKMNKGMKLVICRNGELVQTSRSTTRDRSEDKSSTTANREAISELFDEMEVIPIMPLSWNDQIEKSTGKVKTPRKIEEKILEREIHERKTYPKKLIDEEEFKPKLKIELAQNKYQIAQNVKPKKAGINLNQSALSSASNPSLGGKVTSVEVIGINNVMQKQTEPHFKLEATEAPPPTANGVPTLTTNDAAKQITNDETLTERQYNQIIENLTRQYVSHRKSQQLNEMKANGEGLTSAPVPPPPSHTSRTTTAIAYMNNLRNQNKNDTMRVNLHSIANDYALASEILNRKKQMNANVNKAYNQIIHNNSRMNSVNKETRSRPNSPNLSINLLKKNSEEENSTIKLSIKLNPTNYSNNSRAGTQNSITRTNTHLHTNNPISKALKSAKSKYSRDIEPMYISFTTAIEPSSRRNSINKVYNNDIFDKRSNLHNPSFTTLTDGSAPSRLY